MEVADHSTESRRVNISPFSISSQVFLIKGRRKFRFGGFNKVLCFNKLLISPFDKTKQVYGLQADSLGR